MNLSLEQLTKLNEIHDEIRRLTLRADKILASGTAPTTIINEDTTTQPKANTMNDDSPLLIYTDGACSGNPGPAGSGAVILQKGEVVEEISESLGEATNNIAELMAIKLALMKVSDKSSTIDLYTDSKYCINMLITGWKAKANQKLIADTKDLVNTFCNLKFHYVKGHSGDKWNERADVLAVKARDRS